jgi:3-oxoadipate enol-lactonase
MKDCLSEPGIPLKIITTVLTTGNYKDNHFHLLKTPSLNIKGTGQPLIWMHGMLNSVASDSIYSFIDFEQLSQQVRLIRYNACDQSSGGDYSWNGLVHELVGIIDSINSGKVILGGVSMGSGTALYTAIRFPERVKALILVTPPPAWEVRQATQALYEKIALKARPDHLPDFLKRIIQRNQDPPEFYEQAFPGTRKKLLDLRLSFDPAYYYSIYHGGAISDFPSRGELKQLNIPTLIVADPNDPGHPVEVAREMHELIPHSELVLVQNIEDYLDLQKNVSHFVHFVQNNNKS